MRIRVAGIYNVAAACCVVGSVAYDFQRQRGDSEQFPGGDWIRSAADASLQGNRLCANLQRADGTRAPRSCVHVQVGQTFNNVNGEFRLIVQEIPGGTWLFSKRNAYRQGDLVCAEVRLEDLSWEHKCFQAEADVFYENIDGNVRIRTPACESLGTCIRGYIMRAGADQLYCQYMECDRIGDLDICCEAAEHCGNVTWCPPGLVTTDRYCPATQCDPERDLDLCCVVKGECLDMGQCLKGFTFKLDALNIFCPRPACDQEIDRDRCCDVAAPCGDLGNQSGFQCPYGRFFNLDDFCEGTSCLEARDRGKCCQEALPCLENFTCPYGYLPKPETPSLRHFCGDVRPHGQPCDLDLDLHQCCDAADPCTSLSCPFGFYDVLGIFCEGVTCEPSRDVPICCGASEPCPFLQQRNFTSPPCAHGEFFNQTDHCDGNPCVEARDRQLCCQVAEACEGLGSCPYGYVFKPNPHDVYCDGLICDVTRDLHLCCDAAELCTELVCPLGYVPRADVATVYCNGVSCELPRDVDTCCVPATNCIGVYHCPHTYTPKVNESYCGGAIPGATTCEVPRDLDNCCDDAEICSAMPCDYGFVTMPDTYCLGVVCERSRDYDVCCEPGLMFTYYKWTPLLLRGPDPDASHIGEIEFYFHGSVVDFSRSEVYSPPPLGTHGRRRGGNSPNRESPDMAVDGNLATKWLDFNTDPPTSLIIKLDTQLVIDSYAWFTSNDFEKRDPIRWRLSASEDGTEWTTLHEDLSGNQGGAPEDAPSTPWARFTRTAVMEVGVPCLAPVRIENAATPSCDEGRILRNGTTCTTRCLNGYASSPRLSSCFMGNMTPYTFTCDAAEPCTAFTCPGGYVARANVTSIYCDGTACELARDRDICCDLVPR